LQIVKDGHNRNRGLGKIRHGKGAKVDLGPKRSETFGHRAPGMVQGYVKGFQPFPEGGGKRFGRTKQAMFPI
jgi:hypothetical protein